MKRYLCPICDRELTAKSYCKTCRKMVKTPIIYDGILPNEDRGNYLLNHQNLHPDRACVEANRDRVCETPQEKRLDERFEQARQTIYKAAARTIQAGQSTAPGSQIWRTGTSSNIYTAKKDSSTSRKRKKGWAVIVAVFAVISMLGDLVSELDVDSWFEPDYDYIQEEPAYSDESIESVEADDEDWGELSWEEVNYDEILAIGECCTSYSHYSLSGENALEEMREYAEKELGIYVMDQSTEMHNYITRSELGEYTHYSRYYHFDWRDGFVSINCDSVTGGIHYIGVYGYNADEVIEVALKAFSIVEEEGAIETLRGELEEAFKSETVQAGCSIDVGKSSVWIFEDLNEVMIEIAPIQD